MSEPMGIQISIGGTITKEVAEELIGAINAEIYDIYEGPETLEDLLKENNKKIKWGGTSNYGECDDLKVLCRKYNLSYLHYSQGDYEYDTSINYWIPGMEEEVYETCNTCGSPVAYKTTIEPLLRLLLSHIKNESKDLPLLIDKKDYKDYVEVGLKDPKKMIDMIEDRVNDMFKPIPEIPPLVIKE